MLLRIGSVKALEVVKQELPPALFDAVYAIVSIIERAYGADRDINLDDGGFVLVARTVDELDEVNWAYVNLTTHPPEEMKLLQLDRPWLNALYLMNNEFAINVFMPVELAPRVLLSELN